MLMFASSPSASASTLPFFTNARLDLASSILRVLKATGWM